MGRDKLLQAQSEAAAVLREGVELLAKFAPRGVKPAQLAKGAAQLGALIANPAEFWALAAAVEAQGDGSTAEPVVLATRYAASRLAIGDFEYVRESLIGQACWASALAVRMAQRASATGYQPAEVQFVKLALAAQRQASATLATAAALCKLSDAAGVTVGDGA
jgi:hypothetical protein